MWSGDVSFVVVYIYVCLLFAFIHRLIDFYKTELIVFLFIEKTKNFIMILTVFLLFFALQGNNMW